MLSPLDNLKEESADLPPVYVGSKFYTPALILPDSVKLSPSSIETIESNIRANIQ